jgi:hypothetical protein
MQRHLVFLFATAIALAFALTGCDQPTDSSDDGSGGNDGGASGDELTFEGQIQDYDLGEQHISPNTDASLGEGTLNADGSFTITLFEAEQIEEELQPVDPEAGSFESFSGFICEEKAAAELNDNAQFAMASALTFASDIDDDGTSEVGMLGLTSSAPDVVVPVPKSAKGDYHVRWIFADQSVTLDTQCRDGERIVELELSSGWNEVSYDLSDRDQIRQYTGSRPNAVEWQLDI